MELIIIGGAVVAVLAYFLFFRKSEDDLKSLDAQASYKVETPATVNAADLATYVAPEPAPVVEDAPAKKPRKPRAPKAENPAKEKAANPKKAADIKATKKSKKA